MITLPDNFVASTSAQVADTLSGISGYLTLVIGVLLALIAVEILIGAFRRH